MKKNFWKIAAFASILMISVLCCLVGTTFADEETSDESSSNTTSISLSPTSNTLRLSSDSEYTETFEVVNDGDNDMRIEVYAAPYSYVYSESEDSYQQSFNNENSYTQITRWVKFKDAGGNWVEKPNFTIKPKETLTVEYKVSTPSNIPAGGQYAVLFAHTLTSVKATNGIRTEASPGMLLYGRSTEGEAITKAEIKDPKIEDSVNEETGEKNIFHATAKVKNSGNIDFNATGTLTVNPIFGGNSYTTENGGKRISIIPDAELTISDEWEESPDFGVYKISWTVSAGGETQTVEKIVFVNPLPFIIITIIVLTIVIVWITIKSRKRKERNARLAV